MLDEAFAAHATVTAAAVEYRPQLRVVRDLEKAMRKLDEEIGELSTRASRARDNEALRTRLEEEIAHLEEEKAELAAGIPEGWDETRNTFAGLTGAEDKARNGYRRAADTSYEDAAAFLDILEANEAFAGLEAPIAGLAGVFTEDDPEASQAAIKEVEDLISGVAGAGDVKSALSAARRAMKPGRVDLEKAQGEYAEALEAYEAQTGWRADAASDIKPTLEGYIAAITPTLGARQQEDLTRDQALFLAGCKARHESLELYF